MTIDLHFDIDTNESGDMYLRSVTIRENDTGLPDDYTTIEGLCRAVVRGIDKDRDRMELERILREKGITFTGLI